MYSYRVFPLFIVILGFGLCGLSFYSGITTIDFTDLDESSGSIIATLGLLAFGLLIVTFRSVFTLDTERQVIQKEYKVFGGRLSKETIRIPRGPYEILIFPKKKRGKGYFQAAIPFAYNISSYDMYFGVNGGLIQIIKTDKKRAIRIAEWLKEEINSEYSIKK